MLLGLHYYLPRRTGGEENTPSFALVKLHLVQTMFVESLTEAFQYYDLPNITMKLNFGNN